MAFTLCAISSQSRSHLANVLAGPRASLRRSPNTYHPTGDRSDRRAEDDCPSVIRIVGKNQLTHLVSNERASDRTDQTPDLLSCPGRSCLLEQRTLLERPTSWHVQCPVLRLNRSLYRPDARQATALVRCPCDWPDQNKQDCHRCDLRVPGPLDHRSTPLARHAKTVGNRLSTNAGGARCQRTRSVAAVQWRGQLAPHDRRTPGTAPGRPLPSPAARSDCPHTLSLRPSLDHSPHPSRQPPQFNPHSAAPGQRFRPTRFLSTVAAISGLVTTKRLCAAAARQTTLCVLDKQRSALDTPPPSHSNSSLSPSPAHHGHDG
jgi:hypothetical protein